MQSVLGIQKRPHLLEAKLYCLQNATSDTMVNAVRKNKEKKKPQESLGHDLTLLVAPCNSLTPKNMTYTGFGHGHMAQGGNRIHGSKLLYPCTI